MCYYCCVKLKFFGNDWIKICVQGAFVENAYSFKICQHAKDDRDSEEYWWLGWQRHYTDVQWVYHGWVQFIVTKNSPLTWISSLKSSSSRLAWDKCSSGCISIKQWVGTFCRVEDHIPPFTDQPSCKNGHLTHCVMENWT